VRSKNEGWTGENREKSREKASGFYVTESRSSPKRDYSKSGVAHLMGNPEPSTFGGKQGKVEMRGGGEQESKIEGEATTKGPGRQGY